MRWLMILLLYVLVPATDTLAHPGATDTDGCHYTATVNSLSRQLKGRPSGPM
jgi:hypothetical protein